MTDLITEARELCERILPAPWRTEDRGDYIEIHDNNTWAKALSPFARVEGDETDSAEFIARSRTLIPELCDALEKAEHDLYLCEERHRIDTEQREILADALEKTNELLQKMQQLEWIPVTEQLPAERGYYLAVIKRIAPDELGGNVTNVKIMRWKGDDWRYAHHIPEWINKEITDIVTHWMELPELPEGGTP